MAYPIDQLKRIVEAAILVADEPLTIEKISRLFTEEEMPSTQEIEEAIALITQECEERPVKLKKVASGYRFQVEENLAPWLNRLWEERAPRYSRAFLETLALIIYRQPITRAEIEEIRGVAVSSNIMKSMLERNWVRIIGQRDVPGRPSLYGTTKEFLDHFNLKTLSELPSLMPVQNIEAMPEELAALPVQLNIEGVEQPEVVED